MGDEFKVQLPSEVLKSIVDANIRSAVVAALSKDPEHMISEVVKAAMTERPRDSSYSDKRSIWDKKVDEMIREEAAKAFAEWLAEQRPKIAKAVREHMGKNATKTINEISRKLSEGLTSAWQVQVFLKNQHE